MAKPQQSKIVKASASQNWNSPRTYGPGKKKPPIYKAYKSEVEVEEYRNFYPDEESVNTHEPCATIIPFNIKRKGFSEITGAFPHKSSRGNLYVMVMYDYDSNKILDEPIKNRQASTIRDVFLKFQKVPKSRGSDPKFYIMDNDFSSDLKEAMKNYRINFQLAPPHMHRRNAA